MLLTSQQSQHGACTQCRQNPHPGAYLIRIAVQVSHKSIQANALVAYIYKYVVPAIEGTERQLADQILLN